MDSSSFRQESHVAQQSRRDKLRIQPSSTSSSSPVQHNLDNFPNNLQQSSVQSALNPDLVQVRNIGNGNLLYDRTASASTIPAPAPAVFTSEMLNFATSSNSILPADQRAVKNAIVDDQELSAAVVQPSTMFHPIVFPNFNASPKASNSDPQGCSSNWRSIDSHPSFDWMVNYSSRSPLVGTETHQKPIFVGDVASNNARATNISVSTNPYLKPSSCINGHQHVQSSLPNPSSTVQVGQKQFSRDMQFTSHQLYQNSLQNVVVSTPASINLESSSERILLPAYGNQSTSLCFDNANSWMNKPVENSHQWSNELGLITRESPDQESRTIAHHHRHQGLSLSLSSNPLSRANLTQFGDGHESRILQSKSKPEIVTRGSGKSLDDFVGTSSNFILRSAGPLGPFTGYATILKSSRFLKPAQELLDEFCISNSELMRICENSGEVSTLASTDAEAAVAKENNYNNSNNNNNNSSGVSSSTFYSSNGVGGVVGIASSGCESYRPEYQQKKAKLLYLQEEVCRRYKQYHQQMEMVATSFESVAGLSAATPYVSLALQTISKNFRCLKHVISDQLRHVTKALGEDLLSHDTGLCSKGNTSPSRLRYMDHSFHRHKPGGANVGFFEPQQHVWRPQRGLPERSVAILRAWLFEHFLHPYPTDTDKHMLATQTGLSRNQVSNWFINARVRVWKPMVEEIHMLETKGLTENNQTSVTLDGKSAEGSSQPILDQPSNDLGASSTVEKQLECYGTGSSGGSGVQQWNQEKRSRVEFQVPTSMDGSVMNFLPYQRSGIDIGGLGPVSLTLGLRHGVENAQQQQQQHPRLQQHGDQIRHQFGGQMIHDFVG